MFKPGILKEAIIEMPRLIYQNGVIRQNCITGDRVEVRSSFDCCQLSIDCERSNV